MGQGKSRRHARGEATTYGMGRNYVSELLRAFPDRAHRLLLLQGHRDFGEIPTLAEQNGIPIEIRDARSLSALVQSESHQGVVIAQDPEPEVELSEVIERSLEASSGLLLLVDGVQDPQNFGAILRAADCFGVAGVVWSKNRTVPITPTVRKASVGGVVHLALAPVANLAQAAKAVSSAGFWILGADAGPGSVPWSLDTRRARHRALVLGSEGDGIQRLVAEQVHELVRIPMVGHVDSLNVSQAAAILLHAQRLELTAP